MDRHLRLGVNLPPGRITKAVHADDIHAASEDPLHVAIEAKGAPSEVVGLGSEVDEQVEVAPSRVELAGCS
jgi:hypothetical protein